MSRTLSFPLVLITHLTLYRSFAVNLFAGFCSILNFLEIDDSRKLGFFFRIEMGVDRASIRACPYAGFELIRYISWKFRSFCFIKLGLFFFFERRE